MNNKYFILGLVLVVLASFLLVMQVDFSTQKKNEDINMYIFKDKGIETEAIYPYVAKDVEDPSEVSEETEEVLSLHGIVICGSYPYEVV